MLETTNWTTASHDDLQEAGRQVGKDLFQHNTREVEAIGAPGIEDREDYKENLLEVLSEAEENYRCYSPFEFFAKELNEREDADEAWESYEAGIHDAWEKELEECSVPILEDKAGEIVEERLNEILATVEIGQYRYDPGLVLRYLDPVAFQQEVLSYLDSEGLELV